MYRTPKSLSPSSLAKWEEVTDDFFLRYIVAKDIRPEREPQTGPMSVGSAFDALVKNNLYEAAYGREKAVADGYKILTLVQEQCEPHTLPESLAIACDVFDQYATCGALENLSELINTSAVKPRMEFEVVAEVGGVPLMGKPDLHFHTVHGAHIITDWKVSGAVSRHGVSPQQGFQIALDTQQSRTHGTAHKKYVPTAHPGGVEVNGVPMNETTSYWADQLATYAWALGEPVGSQDFVVRIEQLACRPCPKKDPSDRLRVKSVVHQSTVSADYQGELLERYQRCWHHIQAGHYFPELSKSESDARCNLIVRQLSQPSDIRTMTVGQLPSINW